MADIFAFAFDALKQRYDDDFVDRLNYYYTSFILLILALTLSAKQYVGQPIQCWTPAQFTGAWEQYAENYCFVQNTYYVPLHSPIPASIGVREEREIGYYQWVPFILALQALLFYLPCIFWRMFNYRSGLKLRHMLEEARNATNMEENERERTTRSLAANIFQALSIQRSFARSGGLHRRLKSFGSTYGIYLMTLYLCLKIAFIINVVCQFFILNAFLSTGYRWWGYEILQDIVHGREWQESGHFPRVTLCDFDVKVLGNVQRHSIQCVLMINMFNEKVYLFLWWWILLVAVATLLSFVRWLAFALMPSRHRSRIGRFLRICLATETLSKDRILSSRFYDLVRPDGAFVIQLIASNAGDLVAYEVTVQLWKHIIHATSTRQNGIRRLQYEETAEKTALLGKPLTVVLEDDDEALPSSADDTTANTAELKPL